MKVWIFSWDIDFISFSYDNHHADAGESASHLASLPSSTPFLPGKKGKIFQCGSPIGDDSDSDVSGVGVLPNDVR